VGNVRRREIHQSGWGDFGGAVGANVGSDLGPKKRRVFQEGMDRYQGGETVSNLLLGFGGKGENEKATCPE